MRSLAGFTSLSLMVLGSIGALACIVLGFVAMEGDTIPALGLFGAGFGVFLTASAAACMLSLLASIDQRLEALSPQRDEGSEETSDDWSEEDLSKAMFLQNNQFR